MKEINMYVRGREDYNTKIGCWIVVLEYKGRTKYLKGKGENTTTNRMIITGVIEAIKTLKEPLYTHTYLGFKTKKSPNKDLIDELKKSIKDNEHILKEVVSQEKQKELAKILKTIF
ncbi:hypothetical protein [Clostridium sp.]|uniref:hypothetical protein n=1 Tax=Clostridium sp. TaxID=1506 RepID=UPI00290E9FE6|nr:hypothetical protein [Clostridium sp.]MDU4589924.1 hypothetical protein [Clostridium sp.]